MDNLPEPTNNRRLTLTQQITVVTEQLRPASPDAIAAAVLQLARDGMSYPPSLDKNTAGQSYYFALRGVAIEGLRRGFSAVRQGTIPGISRDFIPTPAALGAICRKEAAELWREKDRLRLTQESLTLGREVKTVSDAAKERVRALRLGVIEAAKQVHVEASIYSKPEDEMNRIFRNKLPPDPPSPDGKWSDEQWHQQQKENEDGESSQNGDEIHDNRDDRGQPEGQSERPFGFEDD